MGRSEVASSAGMLQAGTPMLPMTMGAAPPTETARNNTARHVVVVLLPLVPVTIVTWWLDP